MVRHDDPGLVDVFLTLEYHEDVLHEIAGFRFAENAGTGTFVESFREALGETAVELEFLLGSPRFRVLFQGRREPCFYVSPERSTNIYPQSTHTPQHS